MAECSKTIEINYKKESDELQSVLVKLQTKSQTLQGYITTGNQNINHLVTNKNNEVAKVPAHLRAINAAKINAFTANIDSEILKIQNAITEVQNELITCNTNLSTCQTHLQTLPTKKAAALEKARNAITLDVQTNVTNADKGIRIEHEIITNQCIAEFTTKKQDKLANDLIKVNEATEQAKQKALKEQALETFEALYQNNLLKLQGILKTLKESSRILTNESGFQKATLFKEYTHAFMGFTGQLVADVKDNFKIVGGCGLSLPNLKTLNLDNGQVFMQALKEALAENQEGTLAFSFNNMDYRVLSIPVVDAALGLQSAPKANQKALFDLMTHEVEVSQLEQSMFNEKLDQFGASFMHYAAASLDKTSFEQLSGTTIVTDAFGNTPLHFAAQSGNAEVIPLLIAKEPALLAAKNNNGATALFLAIEFGQLDCVKALISLNANVNARLPNDLFPLYVALQNNYEAIALYLLDNAAGIAIDEKLNNNMTVLHLAIDTKQFKAAKQLIQKGAATHIKRKSDGFNAIHCAAKNGDLDHLKLMKEQGADFTILLESGKSLMHVAAQFGQLAVVQELMAYGLSVDAKSNDGSTPLMLAIQAGHLEVAEVLAEQVEINAVNKQNESASLLAIKYGMTCIGDTLLARGESAKLIDSKGHDYAYYLIRNGEKQRFFAGVKSGQIDIDQLYNGKNALELALHFKQFIMVYPLQKAGLTTKGLSILEYAVIADEMDYVRDNFEESQASKLAYLSAKEGSLKCLKWFLKKLSSAEITNLFKASLEGMHLKTIALILDKTQDINIALDDKGNRALHWAVKAGSYEVLELLISRGVDIKLRNNAGHTPFHITILQEDDYLLKRLFKLTHTSANEWPSDIWNLNTNPKVAKIVKHYQVFAKVEQANPEETKPILPEILLDNSLKLGLKVLNDFFIQANYEEAIEALEENPNWFVLFKSQQGAKLLRHLFENMYDPLVSIDADKKEEILEQISPFLPHKLLNLLKIKGVDPALMKGKHNVLLAMLRAKKQEVGEYRLSVLSQHFPESLVPLAMDELSAKTRLIELALKLNKTYLFETLERLCRAHESQNLFALHAAVSASDYNLVQKMLKIYPVDCLNLKGETPLMKAAAINHVNIMELLLAHGACCELKDILGQTALHHALLNRAKESALNLLTQSGDKNPRDRFGRTPLMLAAGLGLLPVIRELCSQGNYEDFFDNKGLNALHYAAVSGEEETVRYLISQGFSVDVLENPKGDKKMARNLKRTPLHLATLHGHLSTINALIVLHANLEQQDSRGDTFFEYAIKGKNDEVIELVSQHPLYHTEERRTKRLHAAIMVDKEDIVGELILEGIALNKTNKTGATALHIAAIYNSGNCAQLLISGGDLILDAADQFGNTALHYAAMYGHVWLIELLANAKANLNVTNNKNQTPLFLACQEGHVGAAVALLKVKADVQSVEGHLVCAKALQEARLKCTEVSVLVRHSIFSLDAEKTQASSLQSQLTC